MLLFVEFGKPIGDYCEATSASFGAGSSPIAGGASRRAQANDLFFTKNHDNLSAALIQNCAIGTVFKTVTVELYKNAESGLYVMYTLTDSIISSFQSNTHGESIGVNYGNMSSKYYL